MVAPLFGPHQLFPPFNKKNKDNAAPCSDTRSRSRTRLQHGWRESAQSPSPEAVRPPSISPERSRHLSATSDPSPAPLGIALELCAGSAGLCASLHRVGLEATGVDHTKNSHRPKHTVVNLDLSRDSGKQVILRVLQHPRLVYVHMGPPCGTASRAREIRRKWKFCPKPLRSKAFPRGLPTLKQTDPRSLLKVNAANRIYELCATIAKRCSTRGIPWSVENPGRSLFWDIPEIKSLLDIAGCDDVVFDNCMHGGKRPKSSRFRCWPHEHFKPLALKCDNSHTHLPWGMAGCGRFATILEAEYPELLCDRLASCVVSAVSSTAHLRSPSAPSSSASHESSSALLNRLRKNAAEQAAAARQPRGRIIPEVVSEFSHTTTINLTSDEALWATSNLGAAFKDERWLGGTLYPQGSKILQALTLPGACGPAGSSTFRIGVARSPASFLHAAQLAPHPFEDLGIADDISKAVFWYLTRGPTQVTKFRSRRLQQWKRDAAKLEESEKRLREATCPSVRRVLGTKRVRLLRKILLDLGFPGAELLSSFIASGFPVIGDFPATGVFPAAPRPASCTVQDLWRDARATRQDAISSLAPSGDPELDTEVTRITEEEAAPGRGWLEGPFSQEELSVLLGPCWSVSPRFGLRQGERIRAIDDYSRFGQNSSTFLPERLDPGGIDHIAGVIRTWLRAIANEGWVRIVLSSGQVLEAPIHPEWAVADLHDMYGRVVDLANAYRQLPCRPADAAQTVIGSWNARLGRPELYIQRALPFGASAAVMAFNWVARAIRWILVRGLRLMASNYFDDFTFVESRRLATQTEDLILDLMSLLGFDIKDGKHFASTFDVLGVTFDLTRISEGLLVIDNKASRKHAISMSLLAVRGLSHWRPSEAKSLRGRCVHAAAATFGRCAMVPLRALTQFAEAPGAPLPVSDELISALEWLSIFFLSARPRHIRGVYGPPILIFTDGACEYGDTSITQAGFGAVLFDPVDNRREFFGGSLPHELCDLLSEGVRRQIIEQAELVPVLLSKHTWRERLQGRAVLHFIDHDGCKFSLIRGSGRVSASSRIIHQVWQCELDSSSFSWFSRVPSASNLSDGPSRLDHSAILALGFSKIDARFNAATGPDALLSLLSSLSGSL